MAWLFRRSMSFGVVAVFLRLAAILASYVAVRRAMAVDPIIALRNEYPAAFLL